MYLKWLNFDDDVEHKKFIMYAKISILTLYLIETLLTLLETKQTQIRQLLWELPNQGLLCLLMNN